VEITTGFPVIISCDGIVCTLFANNAAKEVKAEV
jgi:hypothetical protein